MLSVRRVRTAGVSYTDVLWHPLAVATRPGGDERAAPREGAA